MVNDLAQLAGNPQDASKQKQLDTSFSELSKSLSQVRIAVCGELPTDRFVRGTSHVIYHDNGLFTSRTLS